MAGGSLIAGTGSNREEDCVKNETRPDQSAPAGPSELQAEERERERGLRERETERVREGEKEGVGKQRGEGEVGIDSNYRAS